MIRRWAVKQYLDLLREVRQEGVRKLQRAVLLSTQQRPEAFSLFGRQMRFDLTAGFPLVTTRRIRFEYVVGELLWFLSGSTNNRDLLARGVTFWTEWADPETGELGPIYGQQWRRWESPHGEPVDQIANLVRDVRAVVQDPHHPSARRLLLTAWNPADMPLTRGPSGCHTFAQFNVTRGRLSCQFYQRSADLFLGVPYNIACYALLTHLLAHVAGLRVGELIHTLGDAHIYSNHLDAVDRQLVRAPLPLPNLRLANDITSLDGLRPEQMVLEDYRHQGHLGGEVAV
jgi:thymidylate synthase